jgi:hypothetical protein
LEQSIISMLAADLFSVSRFSHVLLCDHVSCFFGVDGPVLGHNVRVLRSEMLGWSSKWRASLDDLGIGSRRNVEHVN